MQRLADCLREQIAVELEQMSIGTIGDDTALVQDHDAVKVPQQVQVGVQSYYSNLVV